MKIVGLTGGIASGKSTVAQLLMQRGVPVIDADQLARDVVQPGQPAHGEVARRWPDVVRSDGAIDRGALGAKVFADDVQRAELTSIVVPRIVEAFLAHTKQLASRGVPCVVFEAPTLFENNLEHLVSGVLLVAAPEDEQVRRLVRRSGLTPKDARQRLAAQLSLAEKRKRARWVLENDGPPEALAERLSEIWRRVCKDLGLPA